MNFDDTPEEAAFRSQVRAWLDANAPFYGTYEKEAQLAQQTGQTVAPPTVQ